MLDSEPLVTSHETDADTSASNARPDSARYRVDSPQQYANWREYAFSDIPEDEQL